MTHAAHLTVVAGRIDAVPLDRKANGSFKGATARLAFPEVPHIVLIDVFRPFRHEQPLATFGAFDDWGVGRAEVHGPSLALAPAQKCWIAATVIFAVPQRPA